MYKCSCTTYPYEIHFVLKKSNRVSLSVASYPNLSSNSRYKLCSFQRIISDKYAFWSSSPKSRVHSGEQKVFYFKFVSMKLKLCQNENWTLVAQMCTFL